MTPIRIGSTYAAQGSRGPLIPITWRTRPGFAVESDSIAMRSRLNCSIAASSQSCPFATRLRSRSRASSPLSVEHAVDPERGASEPLVDVLGLRRDLHRQPVE